MLFRFGDRACGRHLTLVGASAKLAPKIYEGYLWVTLATAENGLRESNGM